MIHKPENLNDCKLNGPFIPYHGYEPHKHLHPKEFKSVYVKETCKVAEITDAFNNLRYKVVMSSYDVVNDGKYELSYQIQVINYFFCPEPLIVFERPDVDEPQIKDINVAQKIYDECVKTYTDLVKAETRDYQDIDVYKSRIGYEITCPKCCATCKWSRTREKDIFRKINCIGKMRCINPKNQVEYNTDLLNIPLHNFKRMHFEERFGHKDLPQDNSSLRILPKVEPLGVCINYEVASRSSCEQLEIDKQ